MQLDVGSELIPQNPIFTFGMIALGNIWHILPHIVIRIPIIQNYMNEMRYVTLSIHMHPLTCVQVGVAVSERE